MLLVTLEYFAMVLCSANVDLDFWLKMKNLQQVYSLLYLSQIFFNQMLTFSDVRVYLLKHWIKLFYQIIKWFWVSWSFWKWNLFRQIWLSIANPGIVTFLTLQISITEYAPLHICTCTRGFCTQPSIIHTQEYFVDLLCWLIIIISIYFTLLIIIGLSLLVGGLSFNISLSELYKIA